MPHKTERVFEVDPNLEIKEELIGLHALNPFIANNSSARSYMFSNHLSQIVTLQNGEERIVQTGLEKQFAGNTFSKKLANDSRILAVIDRYSGVDIFHASETTEKTVVYEDLSTGEVGTVNLPWSFSLHQYFGFGYKWNEDVLDNISNTTIVPGGTVLADSPAVGKNDGYKFGINANLAYLSIPEVSEDGVVISKSMAKKLSYKIFEKRVVEFGEDSFPLNLYGDEDNYKAFPDIGENIGEDSVVMALRSYDSELSPALTSKKDVMDFNPIFDKAVYVKSPKGKVVDIKAYHNPKFKKSVYTGTSDGVDKYVNGLKKYYQDLINAYERLQLDHYRKFKSYDMPITDEFHRTLLDAYAVTGSEENKIKFSHRNEKLDIYRIEFTIEYTLEPNIGAKVTTGHGSKGVIVEIREDDQMPVDEFGNVSEIIMDPTSIPGRMNAGNLYEQYFNAMSRHTKKIIEKEVIKHGGLDEMTDADISQVFKVVLGLIDIIGTEQADAYHKADKHQKRSVISEVIREELYIYYKVSSKRKPYQIVMDVLGTMYEPPLTNIKFRQDGSIIESVSKMHIAPQYIILLAKTPENFLSTASAKTNHYGLPIGVGSKARTRLPWRNSPVKILSETESRLNAAYVSRRGLAELKDRGNSIHTHGAVYENILTAPIPTNMDEVINRKHVHFGRDSAIEFIDNIVNAAGMDIVYSKDNNKEHP